VVHFRAPVGEGVRHFEARPECVRAVLSISKEQDEVAHHDPVRMDFDKGRKDDSVRWLAAAGRVHLGR
jgi:hypothetical protein